MKEIELIEKRNKKEKHFLQEDGTIIAKIYNDDIHFLKNGKFEEIDNTLVKKNGFYINKNNQYKVSINEDTKNGLMKLELNEHYITINLKNSNGVNIQKSNKKSKYIERVKFENILDDIDLDYDILPTKIKESIILKKAKKKSDEIIFDVDTDLILELNSDKSINAKFDGIFCFIIEPPYMIDANGKRNSNCYYELIRKNKKYELKLILDQEWLNSEDIKYPVLIDPTISTQNTGVYDTYIYPGDSNTDRNSQDILKIGVERKNNQDIINRALIKFDLPTIGTGSQIIQASLNLFSYPGISYNDNYNPRRITIHEVLSDWNELTANWNNMNDKYDSRILGWFYGRRSISGGILYPDTILITEIVKKWYEEKNNYGIMLKDNEEVYSNELVAAVFSKNNSYSNDNNPKPYLIVHYRNQSGLEKYMSYSSLNFNGGSHYINNYNGNLITAFNLGKTIGGKLPVSLSLFYNTNDIILNKNLGFGIGYKLNLQQMIKEITIDGITYLEYVDGDGTIHYFKDNKMILNTDTYEITTIQEENTFYDEDGLDMIIIKNSNEFILKDKNNNTMIFNKINNIGYLTEIKDINDNKISINYNTNNLITKIIDANNSEINIVYETNKIVINSPEGITTLNYTNNKLEKIETIYGNVLFEYNPNNCISKITDNSNLKFLYEYYTQLPYRMKKVIEYGINNAEGKSLNFSYGFNSTTIIDNKGMVNTLTFKNNGTITSISNLKSKENIEDAFATNINYGDIFQLNNKLTSVQTPIKYVKNYLTNSSFENGVHGFTSDMIPESDISIIDTDSRSGNKCLRFIASCAGDIRKTISVPRGKYYTFSAYIKGQSDFDIYLSCDNGREDVPCSIVHESNEFLRYSASIYFPESSDEEYGELSIVISTMYGTGNIIYIDDMQLEEGNAANHYNYIENSDFENGIDGFTITGRDANGNQLVGNQIYEIVSLSARKKALKLKMNPSHNLSMNRVFDVSGKSGESYNISFWYKNEGVEYETESGMGEQSNNINLRFYYDDTSEGSQLFPAVLHANKDEWQFLSFSFVAERDFSKIEFNSWHSYNANNLYITNMSLFKDVRTSINQYGIDENLENISGFNQQNIELSYDKNNQLIKIMNPRGNKFIYEYDNEIIDRPLRLVSSNGISNEIIYDSFGNPIYTKITNYDENKEIENGLYVIRCKGTRNYIRLVSSSLIIDEDKHHDLWNFVKDGEYFKINHSINTNLYLTNINNVLTPSLYQNNKSLFKLIKNNNGSYSLQNKENDKYVKIDNNILIFSETNDDYKYQFYFESLSNNLFIEHEAEYTDDGRFIKSITDTNFHKRIYETDEIKGLTKSIIDSNGLKTEYSYNNKNQLIKIKTDDREINYIYNSNNLVSKITQGTKEYNFIYDEFLNLQEVNLNNSVSFIKNNYGVNNGNLLATVYNNNNLINYEYDEFNRYSKLQKMNNTFNFNYDCRGNVTAIIDNYHTKKFVYDLANRLCEYYTDDMRIEYQYDTNDNVINKKYSFAFSDGLDNYYSENNIEYEYNNDEGIVKTIINDSTFDYIYDKLGRLINRTINDHYATEYSYINNGNRTSLLIDSIRNNDNIYNYKYDKLDNITHIYYNGELVNKYDYDQYSQLIEENNYLLNQTIRYKYDNTGNILEKNFYELNSYNLLKRDTYEYNNISWEDQLTKFNSNDILYDNAGNPIKIGDENLTWINGYELNSYEIGNRKIHFEYNENGVRIGKKILNLQNVILDEIIYLLEDKKIVLEKHNNYMLSYQYDDVEGLVGFTKHYTDTQFETYYYLKNIQNDIVGILDQTGNLIAKYQYDSWGNIISIIDENGNDIQNNLTHIANINPFRYRGYYYDVDINLYYLNNRYYNSEIGRFLSPDGLLQINSKIIGCNLYSYAGNNPINNYDVNGCFWNKLKNKIRTTYNYVKNEIKSLAKKVSNKINEISKKISTEFKEHFVFEFGVGPGLDVNVGPVDIGYSKDITYGYSNGESTSSTITSFGASVGDYGYSKSYEHFNDTSDPLFFKHNNPMSFIWEIDDCEFTQITETVGHSTEITNNAPGMNFSEEYGKNSAFIGIDFDFHVVIGIHFKIGYQK